MLTYTVRPHPETHLYEVALRLQAAQLGSSQSIVAASWTTGSYLMREFASKIRAIHAVSLRTQLPIRVERLEKARWHIHTESLAADDEIEIRWQTFAFSLGIHDAWLDRDRGFINPAALYVFPQDAAPNEPVTLIFEAPGYEVLCALPESDKSGAYIADSLERFLDSPAHLIGPNARCCRFSTTVCGTAHEILITGVSSINIARLKEDFEKIFETVIRFWSPQQAQAPFKRYLLSLHLAPNLYGGLEHAEGTVLLHDPKAVPAEGEADVPKDYVDLLTLVAHEYFHAWLVKRIRPDAFVPYDLTREAYTPDLWLYEGFTSYYESRLPFEAGLLKRSDWCKAFGERLSAALSREGFDRMTLAESSLAAWVKLYRQCADSPYSQTSYYSKGALLAFILDRKIRALTSGGRSLDDVLRGLYQEYLDAEALKQYAGLPAGQLANAIRRYAGCNLDSLLEALTVTENAHGIWQAELKEALASLNLSLEVDPAVPSSFRFAGLRAGARSDEKVILQYVPSDSPAFAAGLFAGDELIAVDGDRTTASSLNRQIERLRGRSAEVLWFRTDRVMRGMLDLRSPLSDAFLARLPKKIVEADLADQNSEG